jgi:hypothetical protein
VSLPVAIFAFSQALGYARRAGSLGQY